MGLFAHPLAYVRHQRGWSATEFLALVADAADPGLRLRLPHDDRAKVSRWETRGTTPEPAVQRAIARLLRVPAARLTEAPWPRWLPAFDGVRPVVGWSPSGAVRALADALSDPGTDPRGYLAVSGPPLVAVGRRWLDRRPAPLTAVVRGPLRVSEAALAGIDRQAWLLRSLEESVRPERVEAIATAYAGLALDYLRHATLSLPAARRLHRAAAALGILAGWAAHDSGRQFAAQCHFLAALHSTQVVGDRALGAYVLMCLGHQAIAAGSPSAGVRLTEAGNVRVPGDRVRAVLAAYRALALIAAGRDPAAAQRVVSSRLDTGNPGGVVSSRLDTGSPAGGVVSWLGWFEPPMHSAHQRRYLLLDGGQAVPALGGARLLAAGPTPRRTHLLLHRLAEQLAASPSSAGRIGAQLRAHRLRAA